MGPLGMQELLVIGVICVLLFGAKKIPEVAKGLGEGIPARVGHRATRLLAGDEGHGIAGGAAFH